ncbi:MAG: restriction endonuclease subunit S [Nitrosotalea sp.]
MAIPDHGWQYEILPCPFCKKGEIIQQTQLLKKSLMHQLLTKGINHTKLKQTEIGNIPNEWRIVKLEDVCTTRNEMIQPNVNDKGRFVGLEHVDPSNPRLTRYGIASNVKSSKFVFYAGDILYGKLRPYLDKAVISDFDGISSTDLIVLTPKEQISSKFLIHIIHSSRFIQHANLTTTGTNHPRTSWKSLKEFIFGLPSISEQEKIASIIFEIDQKIDFEIKRKALLEQIKRGLMNDLLTGKKRLN